ncbi:MAG: nucleotide sugar dehydrogenase [Phenylobacterium sp.]|uniref:nucleotide sugar dehydrogenase n=1 Tax=Phenylobacterium sp. TaxID=1871053 RepID=UPI002732DA19|nr:nucleotide sugar dehydrogenase [Phenylobacterium sp.]MDP3748420.1 nucleotide sugar dehydrogenase [Phenylobacterium sp.]
MSEPASQFETLVSRLETRDAVIGIVGLGYVGLPLALACIDAGFRVLGFDINARRVASINSAEQVIRYISAETMKSAIDSGLFDNTTDFSRLAEADAILICVPTPITRHRDPDLSFVSDTAATISKHLRPGQLVVLESTTWPGTTREIVHPLLEATGLKVGEDVFLAFSPEREDPGNPNYGTKTIPKVVGADDAQSRDLAVKLYGQIISKVVAVSSAAAAEATKLTENIFRSVNIALVNELKLVYGAMGVDVWEVIAAAATKPFGFMPFYPGPGLGGHCIPVDPFYLTWKAREFGMETRFIELAGQINSGMPRVVVDRLADELNNATGKGLKGSRILLMGVAYKKNVDDTRESPSLVLIEQIEHRGAVCDFHDPHIAEIPETREHAGLAGRKSTALTAAMVAGYDAVLVSTDHDAVDYALIAANARLILDTRNVFARLELPMTKVIKA